MTADMITQQGDVQYALEQYEESLSIAEQTGDVKGKAATLVQMALLAGQTGDAGCAVELDRQAISGLVQVQDWLNVVTMLEHLSDFVSEAESLSCLAQAFWLALRLSVPVEQALELCAQLLEKTGEMDSEHAPLLAAAAVAIVGMRGKEHPKFEMLQQHASRLMIGCLQGQGIALENAQQWLEQQKLIDSEDLFQKLDTLLQGWVTEWYFDIADF